MAIDPTRTKSPDGRQDLAYACFLPPGIVSLISALSAVIPMDSGVAGGIGFLVLIPLSLVALVSVPTGIYFTIVFRKEDAVLVLLSVSTIFMLAGVVADAGSTAFASVYGLLVMILVANWFLARRPHR
jgi:hypothetical protein